MTDLVFFSRLGLLEALLSRTRKFFIASGVMIKLVVVLIKCYGLQEMYRIET